MKDVPSLKTEGGGNDDNRDDGWWRTANLGECPITLECFSTLGYPPFALYHPGKNTTTATTDVCTNRDGISAYFDGLALASYIVSRGVFQNPLTRIELTAEDCRRLDRYLEDHCYSSDAASTTTIFRGSRVISVAEAFALRNSVSVETATMRSDGRQSNNNNERDRERIQALQNTATAALAGLFVYGNDRRHPANDITSQVPQLRNETSFLLNDWGFDLTRRVEDTSAQGTHGYTVIDDNEVIAIASQRHAYETVQEAFPPLTEPTSRNPRDCESSGSPIVSIDERLMERIRTLSVRDEEEQKRHAQELEKGREQLLRHALERRKQRQKDRADRLARGAEHSASQRKDEAELERVRMEIEAWRDDQWEKLRLLSEHGQHNKKDRHNNNSVSKFNSGEQNPNLHEDGGGSDIGEAEAVVDDGETMIHAATAEEKKKAKSAAKRKRAKERKKEKNTLEKEEAETLRLRKAKETKRAASTLKCSACGTGILKPSLAFERFDQLFCSPKCARTAVKLVPG
jgi:ribosomal protein L44E